MVHKLKKEFLKDLDFTQIWPRTKYTVFRFALVKNRWDRIGPTCQTWLILELPPKICLKSRPRRGGTFFEKIDFFHVFSLFFTFFQKFYFFIHYNYFMFPVLVRLFL